MGDIRADRAERRRVRSLLPGLEEEQEQVIQSWRQTAVFLRDRPYLRVPARAADLMPRPLQRRARVSDASVPDWKAAKEQDQLDDRAGELRQLYDTTPSIAGVRSGRRIHSDAFHLDVSPRRLLHLLGNMFFLYATGPFVRKPSAVSFFPIFYLTGGSSRPWVSPPATRQHYAAESERRARLPPSWPRTLFYLRAIANAVPPLPVVFLPFWKYRFTFPALVVLPLWFRADRVDSCGGRLGGRRHGAIAGFLYGLVVSGVAKLVQTGRSTRGIVCRSSRDTSCRRAASGRSRSRHSGGEPCARESSVRISMRSAWALTRDQEARYRSRRCACTRLLEAYALSNEKDAAVSLIGELGETAYARQFLGRAAAITERWGDRPGRDRSARALRD